MKRDSWIGWLGLARPSWPAGGSAVLDRLAVLGAGSRGLGST